MAVHGAHAHLQGQRIGEFRQDMNDVAMVDHGQRIIRAMTLLADQHGGGLVSPDVVRLDAPALGFSHGLMLRDPDGHAMRVVAR